MPKRFSISGKVTQYMIVLILAAVAAVALFAYLRYQHYYPSTDDAYVQANVTQIAPQVSGPVKEVFVKNLQKVHTGQTLFTIDQKPFKIALNKAKAQLALTQQTVKADQATVKAAQSSLLQQEANLLLAQKNAARILTLVKQGQMTQQQGDQARNKVDVAKAAVATAGNQLSEAKAKLGQLGDANAQIKSARAAIAQAELNLSYTIVRAPQAGRLVNMTVQPGNAVQAGAPLFSVIDSRAWWVNANFKETQLDRIRKGQSATIKLDMYPKYVYKGVVVDVSQGSGSSFSLLPAENATGNWVKVTQRFAVRVKILKPNPKYPLRVGASSTVTINTRSVS